MPPDHSSNSKLIALDCDGVLLDYNEAYQRAWYRAFGVTPKVRNPNAYWARERFDVPQLDAKELAHFEASKGEEFRATMLPIAGAVEACHRLIESGYRLVCVTVIEERYRDARLRNLSACGFPIDEVIVTPHGDNSTNPKAHAITVLSPLVFVDDFALYFAGVSITTHRALILRETEGSPNVGEALSLADSTHSNLASFADAWLAQLADHKDSANATRRAYRRDSLT